MERVRRDVATNTLATSPISTKITIDTLHSCVYLHLNETGNKHMNFHRAAQFQKLARILFIQGDYVAAAKAYATARKFMGIK